MSSIISVKKLGKSFWIDAGKKRSKDESQGLERGSLSARLSSLVPAKKEFWALRDINFEVNEGESVGIIGPNGAGKSTLLKILSRITMPTEGELQINGTVCSLLQVGAGFHNELTGRENIFLNGSILGLNENFVKEHVDEIIDFSELQDFIDVPIKYYSSGMRVRLGFSIAANLDPQIFMLDEVLAVGDTAFRKKCMARLNNEIINGKTLIYVSHSMEQVKALVSRCIVIENGSITFDGSTNDGVTRYQDAVEKKQAGRLQFSDNPDLDAQIISVFCETVEGDEQDLFSIGDEVVITLLFKVWRPIADKKLEVLVSICDETDRFIATASSDDTGSSYNFETVEAHFLRITLPSHFFNSRKFRIRPVINIDGKAHHNHPRFGQYLVLEYRDQMEKESNGAEIGRGSAILSKKFEIVGGSLESHVEGLENTSR